MMTLTAKIKPLSSAKMNPLGCAMMNPLSSLGEHLIPTSTESYGFLAYIYIYIYTIYIILHTHTHTHTIFIFIFWQRVGHDKWYSIVYDPKSGLRSFIQVGRLVKSLAFRVQG